MATAFEQERPPAATPRIDDGDGADNADPVTVETDAGGVETHTAEEVRQGHTGDHVRYILMFSFAGVAIVLFAAYWLFVR